MNRTDFQELAVLRAKEAEVLLKTGRHEGAYYLIGYSIECALKSCIAKKVRRHDFPDRKTVDDSYSHELVKLVGVAGLELELKGQMSADADFRENWTVAKDWSEKARYERRSKKEAEALFNAVTEPVHGVLPWLQKHW